MYKITEHQIQSQIIYLLKIYDIFYFAVPNGIFFNSASKTQSYAYMNKLRAEGFREGVADLVILLKNRTIFIEVKTEKGKQSDKQKDFENKVKSLGFEYYLWRSLEDAEIFLQELHKK